MSIAKIREMLARCDVDQRTEEMSFDDLTLAVAEHDSMAADLKRLRDDFTPCDDCDGTGIGPLVVDRSGQVGDEPCSVCAGVGGVQKSAAQWIAKWHERANEYRVRTLNAERERADLHAECIGLRLRAEEAEEARDDRIRERDEARVDHFDAGVEAAIAALRSDEHLWSTLCFARNNAHAYLDGIEIRVRETVRLSRTTGGKDS